MPRNSVVLATISLVLWLLLLGVLVASIRNPQPAPHGEGVMFLMALAVMALVVGSLAMTASVLGILALRKHIEPRWQAVLGIILALPATLTFLALIGPVLWFLPKLF